MFQKKYDINDFLQIKTSVATSFGPGGRQLSVLSDTSGTTQLYVIDNDGQNLQQLTDFEDNVEFARFSPTENKILFGKSSGGDENAQLYLMDVDTKEYRQLTDRPKYRYGYGGWSRDGKHVAYSSNERNGVDFDIYTMDVSSGKIKSVFKDGGWCYGMGFSPSGRYLAVGQAIALGQVNLYLVDLQSGTHDLLVSSDNETDNGYPCWLPDESGFYFATNKDRDFVGVAHYDMLTKKIEYMVEEEWDVNGLSVTRDGSYMAVSVNADGYDRVTTYELNGMKKLSQKGLPNGSCYGFAWSEDGERLLVNASSSVAPTRSWVWNRAPDTATQLTEPLSKIPEEIYREPELIRYTSFDGLEIPAFLYLPERAVNSADLPVVINIHGGPEGQSVSSFAPLTQYWLQAGYAVVFPNVRGSTGYGKTYMHMDDVEKRLDSVADIAELHNYIKDRDGLDGSRVVLLGGSYGGFMVLAGLAFYPELWAAGVDIVGISNFVSFLENTSAYRRKLREAEYGSLTNDRDFLESASPLNHVDKIKAPLFVIHGKNDPRVPLSEAEQIHSLLTDRGIDTKLRVYDDEGHGISKLKNRLDLWPQVVDFLNTVLK